METARQFVNRFIAEESEQFSESEFKYAVVATLFTTTMFVMFCL